MATIEQYIKSKSTHPTLTSHLLGVIKKHMSLDNDRDVEIDNSDSSKLWQSFTEYTGVVSHAERMHGSQRVVLAQFVDSAIASWTTQHRRGV